MTEFIYLLCKTLLHAVHCFFQAAVHDPCIMLCHTCGGMAEHDGNILKRHIVGKRDRSPESVTGNVRGQILLNAAEIGYFLEIAVHLLVAHDGQTASFLNAGRMFLVFLQYGQGYGQQWNIADGRGLPTVFQFDPSFSYPPVSEIVLYQILFVQTGNIGECQTGETRKKHQSKGDGNKENQTERVVKQRFCGCLPLQPNSKERQDNASFPLPSHYLSCYQLKAKKQHS